MKTKKIIIYMTVMLAFLLLPACGEDKETAANGGTGKVGSNSQTATAEAPVKSAGSCYGVRYDFADGSCREFFVTVDASGKVTDCAPNFHAEKLINKDDYIGKSYEEALAFFFEDISSVENRGLPTQIALIVPEGEQMQDYDSVVQRLCDRIAPGAQKDVRGEKADTVAALIEDFTRAYNEEMAKQAEDAKKEEQKAEEELPEDDNGTAQIKSFDEFKKAVAAGKHEMTLQGDLVIDVTGLSLNGIKVNCEGHEVTVKGTFTSVSKEREFECPLTGIELYGPSRVDLGDLVIADGLFNDEEWVRENFAFVEIFEGNYKNVRFPSGIPSRMEETGEKKSPIKGYLYYDVNDDGDQMAVRYEGPQQSYEERNKQDTDVVTAIFTQGDAYSLFENWTHSENDIWTAVEVNVGTVTLPNQEYMGVSLEKGGSLKLSGNITVTGGRLCFDVSEPAQLDLTGLTLVKKHPSPDMVKINYDVNVGLDTSLLQIKGSGNVKYDLTEYDYCITIW